MPRQRMWIVVVFLLVASACAPTAPPPRAFSEAPELQPVTSRGPKVVTIAARQELQSFAEFTGVGSSGGGNASIRRIAHNYLVAPDEKRTYQPQLATELPSLEKGTWRINPDNSMEMTWTIRPNIKWHDGAPFTSADLEFAFALHKDPAFTLTTGGPTVRLMDSVTASDPSTIVVRWSKPNVDALNPIGLDPMPRHLIEPLYRTDKEALVNSPLFNGAFVGLGPYRITRWESGVTVEFARFDDYYLGRPPLDRVVVRYIKDANTMLANMLAGTVDILLPPSIDLETASELRRRWAGTGNEVKAVVTDRLRFLRPQFRPEFARLENGVRTLAVRRALLHSIDRATLAEVVGQGLVPPADSWIAPTEAVRAAVESAIPPYPYDLARAQQLLSDAGWIRGSDGVLVHQPSGERFEVDLSVRPTTGADQDAAIIADGWKSVGVRAGLYIMPPALADDRQHLAMQPFMTHGALAGNLFYEVGVIHSREITTEANRWGGRNNQGYSNPVVDAVIDRLQLTIEERDRIALHRQLLVDGMGDVAVLPLYWQADPIPVLKGLQGVRGENVTWNIFEWDRVD